MRSNTTLLLDSKSHSVLMFEVFCAYLFHFQMHNFLVFTSTRQWETSGPRMSSNGPPEGKKWLFQWKPKNASEMRTHQDMTTILVVTHEVMMSQFHHTGCDFDCNFDLDVDFQFSDIESDVHSDSDF